MSYCAGERLEMHITYQREVAAKRNSADTKFCSAKNPTYYQISRQEQVLDIMRNVTTTPEDHVRVSPSRAVAEAGQNSWMEPRKC